jgi:hypothetical protein
LGRKGNRGSGVAQIHSKPRARTAIVVADINSVDSPLNLHESKRSAKQTAGRTLRFRNILPAAVAFKRRGSVDYIDPNFAIKSTVRQL